MSKITIEQFLSYTNIYVPIYIEDEFGRNDCIEGTPRDLLKSLSSKQLKCPIDFIRNVDGGHFGDNEKKSYGIVLGIGIDNFELYF